jgi:BCD family chlorophyll transporter-like MFS transporter
VLVVTLLVYGIGRNLANNTFQALVADLFAPGPPRSRAANLYEVVKIVGMIMGAGLVSKALRPYSPERLVSVVFVIAGLVVIFSLIAAVRQEPRTPAMQEASRVARATPFWPTFRALLWNDPTARLFFLIVTLTLFGTQMQDVLLEPYAGLVFGLDVSATTALTMFWGLGTLISILLSGLFLVKWVGLKPLFRVGITILLVLFPMLVVTGYLQNPNLLRLTVLGIGLGTGLAAASLLALMVQFTTVRRAGLMVGVWGVGHQLGRALASLTGGMLVDGMNRITQNNYLVSYGTAFVLEALMLLVALVLIGRLQIESAEALREEQTPLSPLPAA